MPRLKKQLSNVMGARAGGRMRGQRGGDVSTGEFRPGRTLGAMKKARGIVGTPGFQGSAQRGIAGVMGRKRGAAQPQPQPPLTTSGEAIPEVAAADAQTPIAPPAQPNQAPIPAAGAEMGPVPRGVQDAGAGAGGPVTGPPKSFTGLRDRLAQRFAPAMQAGPAGPAPGAAPMLGAYMQKRSNMPPGFRAARQPAKRKSRFYQGA